MANKFPSVSGETKKILELEDINEFKLKTYEGLTPADPASCSCQKLIRAMYKDVADGKKPKKVKCDRSTKDLIEYNIVCKNCNYVVAHCFASDETLKDYCDLKYQCHSDGLNWFGCMALQISPIDDKIGIECACGQDTRDFRANNTLPDEQLNVLIETNFIGREFGTNTSKFVAVEVK